ncbi:MvaI/BcnI family restriction endonuclease [Alistipes onderdonkii]|jgi:hypothetical protein|uniref:MvaI/BcnI restriction endonuclease domain-containing protein n=1 Tax=Alistipes onderdonkii TaxID=328813 RepID=A0A1Y3R0Q1_9BACT|nr:MvaI/BcnI family restriction endonuclease [Alistipes onderdonkii]OUN03219.1 hypothetical protein B5G41_09305 [Alistipes onderdonkii]
MNLSNLKRHFVDNGCKKIYIKVLSPNDNSKNQVYLGGSFEILNIFPLSDIQNVPVGDWNRERFKASIDFSWISEDGRICPAPSAQIILYPKYPEVRFSGFLARCANAPSQLMTQRLAGRLLFLGVTNNRTILGYVAAPSSEISIECHRLNLCEEHGVFKILPLEHNANYKTQLLTELYRIHSLGWIPSKRLDSDGNVVPCHAPNCGGYTLEAELGITPNGYAEPDYLGWEIKQFHSVNLERFGSTVITLMTPEPTHGFYVTDGAEAFIRKYGYPDQRGRPDRMNFGGIHKCHHEHDRTHLKLELIGFDYVSGKIRNTDGRIALLDQFGNEAASWAFSSMLLHWNRKHNQACYIPSNSDINRGYRYGNRIILGEGTDFQFFLRQMAIGNIYYDPGIKLEYASSHPKIKKRSQFRIKSQYLENLYNHSEIVTLPYNS